jgi:hypothetical protein
MVGWPTVTNIVGGHHIVCSVFRCSVCPRIRKYALEGFVPPRPAHRTRRHGDMRCSEIARFCRRRILTAHDEMDLRLAIPKAR